MTHKVKSPKGCRTHVQVVLDTLATLGARDIHTKLQRVVVIVFTFAGRVQRIHFAANPKNAAACAKDVCARLRTICAARVARAGAC